MTQEIPEHPVGPYAAAPQYHTVCRDCIMEAVHSTLRAAASEERAHCRAHPEHELATRRIDQ